MSTAATTQAIGPELIERLREARARLLSLFEDLEGDRLVGPARHHIEPPIWEIGHAAWFQEYWLLRHLDGRAPTAPAGDAMYDAFYVSYKQRTKHDYPSKQATLYYAAAILDAACARLEGREPTDDERYLYELITQHEYMHAENLIGVRNALGYPRPAALERAAPPAPEEDFEPGDVEVPGGSFLLGAPDHLPFAFDNERPAHEVVVEPFAISTTPVTNEAYAAFVDDGGYVNREFWSAEGWSWRREVGAMHPGFWRRPGSVWCRNVFDDYEPLDPWHPVCHVNWYEAQAWCNWAGRRLPTEVEWERAAGHGLHPWGDAPADSRRANLDWTYGDTVDVRALPAGDSALGCRQMIGNVWEWTSSLLKPYPGFEAGPYKEYSEPYFGKKPVLRGGAWVTRSRLIRNSWRNFFVRNRRNVYAGFRSCPA